MVVGTAVALLVASCATTPAHRSAPTTTGPAPPATIHVGTLALTVTGEGATPRRVVPPPGHALGTIDRDAGIAAPLRDGSVLWLFGDTAARDDAGHVVYFEIGTASWAPAADPTATRDAADPATGAPVPFATPTAAFPPCPVAGQRQGMWPASAVVEPVGARDRVVVWMENVCLGSGASSVDDEGMSVAEWWYDPAHPPVDAPIRATVLDQRLFADRSYGSAVVRVAGSNDLVDVYRCHNTTTGGAASRLGPCRIGRTSLATVADASTYREWDGRRFEADVGAGRPMSMPSGGVARYPPGGFGVAFDASVGAFVMVYSPWPGATDQVEVRVAIRPEGPWSRPLAVRLAGCDDHLGQRRFGCYAAGVQPSFSHPGALGLGYYDTMVSSFPTRGSYVVTTIAIRARTSRR